MYSISNFANEYNPLFNFRWIATNLPFNVDSRYVEKVSVPWTTYESIPIYVGGSNNYYNSVCDVEPVNITFYEDSEMTISTMLARWTALIQEGGFYGLPSEYKKNFSVLPLRNNSTSPVGYFNIKGAWPSTISSLEFAYDSSERISIQATFTIDSITYKSANATS